jgi:hypothetical protein
MTGGGSNLIDMPKTNNRNQWPAPCVRLTPVTVKQASGHKSSMLMRAREDSTRHPSHRRRVAHTTWPLVHSCSVRRKCDMYGAVLPAVFWRGDFRTALS